MLPLMEIHAFPDGIRMSVTGFQPDPELLWLPCSGSAECSGQDERTPFPLIEPTQRRYRRRRTGRARGCDAARHTAGMQVTVFERLATVGGRTAAVVVPPRATAVPSETAESEPTQRDRHLQLIAEKGRMGWQKASGYHRRARAEAAIGRWKQVIGDRLRAYG